MAYNAVVGYDTNWGPGGAAQDKGRFTLLLLGANNKQGGALSVVLNQVPGVNATGYLHDTWWNKWATQGIHFNALTNYGTMLPAAAVTYGAILSDPTAQAVLKVGDL